MAKIQEYSEGSLRLVDINEDFHQGMNTNTNIGNTAQNELYNCVNMYPTARGSITRRPGLEKHKNYLGQEMGSVKDNLILGIWDDTSEINAVKICKFGMPELDFQNIVPVEKPNFTLDREYPTFEELGRSPYGDEAMVILKGGKVYLTLIFNETSTQAFQRVDICLSDIPGNNAYVEGDRVHSTEIVTVGVDGVTVYTYNLYFKIGKNIYNSAFVSQDRELSILDINFKYDTPVFYWREQEKDSRWAVGATDSGDGVWENTQYYCDAVLIASGNEAIGGILGIQPKFFIFEESDPAVEGEVQPMYLGIELSAIEPYKPDAYQAREVGFNVLSSTPSSWIQPATDDGAYLENLGFTISREPQETEGIVHQFFNAPPFGGETGKYLWCRIGFFYTGLSMEENIENDKINWFKDFINSDDTITTDSDGNFSLNPSNIDAKGYRWKVKFASSGNYWMRSQIVMTTSSSPPAWDTVEDPVYSDIQTVDYQYFVSSNSDGETLSEDQICKAISRCNIITSRKGRIYLSGDPQRPQRIWFSEVDAANYIGANNMFFLDIASDDIVMSLMRHSDNLLIFTKERTFSLAGNDASLSSSSPFVMLQVSDKYGSVSLNGPSVCNGEYVFFLSKNGIAMLKPNYMSQTYAGTQIFTYQIDQKIRSDVAFYESKYDRAFGFFDGERYFLNFGQSELVNHFINQSPSNYEQTTWSLNTYDKWINNTNHDLYGLLSKNPLLLEDTLLYPINRGIQKGFVDALDGTMYLSTSSLNELKFDDDGYEYWSTIETTDWVQGRSNHVKAYRESQIKYVRSTSDEFKFYVDVFVDDRQVLDSTYEETVETFVDWKPSDQIPGYDPVTPGAPPATPENPQAKLITKREVLNDDALLGNYSKSLLHDEFGDNPDKSMMLGFSSFESKNTNNVKVLRGVRISGKGTTIRHMVRYKGDKQLLLLSVTPMFKYKKAKATKNMS